MKISAFNKCKSIFFILSIIFSSCGQNNESNQEEAVSQTEAATPESNEIAFTEAQYKVAGIELGKLETRQITGTFKANGMLDVPPQQLQSISVPMGGFLRKTDLLQGMHVKKGQLIAVIENPDYVQMQQDYLEAKSQLVYAEADYQRQEALAKENVNAQKTLQQAKSAFQSLTARVNALREKIKASGLNLTELDKGNVQSSINLYAPISGYVTEVNANIGKFVKPTDVIFEIVDTDHLHAELTVFEKDVPKLKIGQKVRFTLANEATERTAHVYLIGREISKDRTVRIHCHMDKEDRHLLPGMYLKAEVESGESMVPALPDEAVVDYQGQKFIFIEADKSDADSVNAKPTVTEPGEHHFEMIAVEVGNKDMGYTEVALPEGISANRIVIKGAYSILSKLKNSGEEEE